MSSDAHMAGSAIGYIIEHGTARGLSQEEHAAAIMGLCSILVMTAREGNVPIEYVVKTIHATDWAMSAKP